MRHALVAKQVNALLFTLLPAACGGLSTQAAPASYAVVPIAISSEASMRGISVVDARVAWASGARGSVLRTVDGGASWASRAVPGADSLDFRDIEAFDSVTAYVLSAGEDGRIYKTTDGGLDWQLQFRNQTRDAFFDCIGFWDARHGIAMSDPVQGRFLLLRTDDGQTWHELPAAQSPASAAGEAAFAASGTCLTAVGARRAYLATGGGPSARVFVSEDRGASWRAVTTPVPAGAATAGIFSLAFSNGNHGIAVGGDYQRPAGEAVVARTQDGGRSWQAIGRTAYVSGAAFVAGTSTVVAVGTTGSRLSRDNGATWMTLDSVEYNAVQFAADGTGYAVGPRGRIAKLLKR